MMPLAISDDLVVRVGEATVTLTPTQGLLLAEDLARKSMRCALKAELADTSSPDRGRA